MKKPLLLSLVGGLALCAVTPAFAQTEPPPAAAPPPNSAPITSVGGGGIGVGAVTFLDPIGLAGGLFVYDAAMFHIEAVLGFGHTSNADNTSSSNFDIGVAGWYHLARGTNADFSIGGGAGLNYASAPGAGNSQTMFSLDPGVEARVFLTPNFALLGRVGFAISFGDNNAATTFSLGGQDANQFGFVYFFR
jgi:hypothetical protein